MNPLTAINGWKTEIGAVVYAVSLVALKLSWIDQATYDSVIIPILGWLGMAIIHKAKKKLDRVNIPGV